MADSNHANKQISINICIYGKIRIITHCRKYIKFHFKESVNSQDFLTGPYERTEGYLNMDPV